MISKLMLLEQKTLKQLVKNKSNVDVNKVKDILQLDPTLKVEMISDDTEIGKYGEWLLGKLYKKYDQLTNEEKNTIKSDLQFYDYQTRSKRIPQEYDNIYKIKSIKELNGIIKKLQDNNNPLTQDPVTVAIGNHQFKTVSQNPFELLNKQYYGEIKEGNTTKWLVFNPKTKEESIVAGYNTSWCTSRDDEKNQWNAYIKEEITAWIFLLSGKYKINNPDEFEKLTNNQLHKICIIVEQGQCQNRINEIFKLKEIPEIGRFIEDRINDNTITLNYSMLNILDSIKYITSGFNNKKNGLFLLTQYSKYKLESIMHTLPEKDQMIIIQQYPDLLKFITLNIRKKRNIQLQQVKRTGHQIKHIIDAGIRPEYDVQMQQVKQTGYQIKYIIDAGVQPEDDNKWHDIQLQQVSKYGYQIKYIIDAGIRPIEQDVLQCQAEYDGELIEYMVNAGIIPNNKVLLYQVKIHWFAIKNIINAGLPLELNVQLEQVTINPDQIKYILDAGIKPHHDVQLQQVTQRGNYIEYIINAGIIPEHDVQLQQVKNNGFQIKYIIDAGIRPIEHDIQLQQVTEYEKFIKFIIDAGMKPEYDVQMQQVTQNGEQIEYIINAGVQPENKNEWKNIQLQQVSQNGYQIKYIENPNEEVQLQQINQNPDQYDYIENPTPKQTQLYKQLSGITESTGYISKLLDVK